MAFTGNGGGGGGGGETSPARLEVPVSLPGGLLPSRRAAPASPGNVAAVRLSWTRTFPFKLHRINLLQSRPIFPARRITLAIYLGTHFISFSFSWEAFFFFFKRY